MSGLADPSQRFAASEFGYLLDHLEAADYRVVECLSQSRERAPRTMSFRYDIHLRDIHSTYGFLHVHRERSVAGAFFLLHGYSLPEKAREAEFVQLAGRIRDAQQAGVQVEIGLHDSPADRYLQWRFADGDEQRYVAWLSSESALAFFGELAASSRLRADFDAAVCERFVESVRQARSALGDLRLSAGHGGKLSQVLRSRLPELGEVGALIERYFSEHCLTPDVLAAAGIAGDAERFKREAPEVAAITEGGGRLVQMCQRLRYYGRVGRPMCALIHPASWMRNVRDGEWSQLLAAPTSRNLSIALSVSPAMWLKDFKALETSQAFDLAVYSENAKPDSAQARDLEARAVECESFIELIGSPRHLETVYEVAFGASLLRYGSLVAATLAAALGARPKVLAGASDELLRRAEALARWLEAEARFTSKPRLTSGELNYFLFSSSRRALGLGAALAHFCKERGVTGLGRLVDHGAGIGFIPLIVDSLLPIGSVACSEVKSQFIEAGLSLWEAVGMASRIEYQPVSVVDFVYPADVDAVFFGHMLYRLPPEARGPTLLAAVAALKPGGLLVVNELMNRPDLDKTYAHKCLTSEELFNCLGTQVELSAVELSGATVKVAPALGREPAFFSRSDNLVVAVRRG